MLRVVDLATGFDELGELITEASLLTREDVGEEIVVEVLRVLFPDAQLRIAELNAPDAFRILLTEALATYYEAPPVVAALGWRAAPPLPHGHDVAPSDDAAWLALDKVKARGQLWRA